jgi:CsoR family transcriptional regulator, copper-sensing transcriptional repressor
MPAKAIALKKPAKAAPPPMPNYRGEYQRDVTNRLKRIEGQVRAVIDMIESDRSCEEVAQQMSAVRKAMDKTFYRMMTCSVMEAASVSDLETRQEVERSTRILEKYA